MEAPKATASGTIDTILWVIDKSPAVFPSQSFDSENRRGERNTECLPGLWSSQALDVISPGIKSEKIDTEHTRTQSPSRRALTYLCGLSVYIYVRVYTPFMLEFRNKFRAPTYVPSLRRDRRLVTGVWEAVRGGRHAVVCNRWPHGIACFAYNRWVMISGGVEKLHAMSIPSLRYYGR